MSVKQKNVLNPDKFAEYLGIASWLCSMSKVHKTRDFTSIDRDLLPPILLKQFRIIRDQKLPIAFLTWATVSADVEAKVKKSEPLALEDWKSGDKLVVVDCIAPFGHKNRIIQEFFDSISVGGGA